MWGRLTLNIGALYSGTVVVCPAAPRWGSDKPREQSSAWRREQLSSVRGRCHLMLWITRRRLSEGSDPPAALSPNKPHAWFGNSRHVVTSSFTRRLQVNVEEMTFCLCSGQRYPQRKSACVLSISPIHVRGDWMIHEGDSTPQFEKEYRFILYL